MGAILDGKALAKKVRAEVRVGAEAFAAERGRAPRLEVVLVGEDPASQVYVGAKERAASKVGIAGAVRRYPADMREEELVSVVEELNHNPEVDGILVQLPLPGRMNPRRVLEAIDPQKDVDGLHEVNVGRLALGLDGLFPCTPSGCMRLLEEAGINLSGAEAVVVGRSDLVGKPIAQMLLRQGATVTICHSRTRDLEAHVAAADIVVAAAGVTELIKGAWIKPGATAIDVGINRQPDGTLVGDIEFGPAFERAAWITPVPGGVGPMTIAMLLQNTVTAARRRAATP